MNSLQRKGQIVIIFVVIAITMYAGKSIFERGGEKGNSINNNEDQVELVEQFNNIQKENKIQPYPSLWGYAGKLIVVLVIMVGLVYSLALVIKRKDGNLSRRFGGLPMDIIGTSYITSKQKIVLVLISDQYFLLGITQQSINLIKEYSPDDPTIEKLSAAKSEEKTFGSVINNFMDRKSQRGKNEGK